MMLLDSTIDMTDCTNTGDVFPPSPDGQLLHTSLVLTSSLMPPDMTGVRSPSAATKASYGVRLTKPVLFRELCKRVSMWLYKMAEY